MHNDNFLPRMNQVKFKFSENEVITVIANGQAAFATFLKEQDNNVTLNIEGKVFTLDRDQIVMMKLN